MLPDTDIKADFCLKAKDDSMVNARILDSDIVFIRKQDIVDNGETAPLQERREGEMSLILGYANKTNAIIMSDGRAGGTVCPSEEYNKTRKINDNIILGFAGYKETSEHFLNCVHMELGERIKNCYIDEFLEVVKYGMDLDATKEHLCSSFIIIGKSRNGNMITSIAGDVTNYKVEKNIADSPRILTIGGTIEGEIINKIYYRNIKRASVPIVKCMTDTIKEVSTLDCSVNTNTFVVTI